MKILVLSDLHIGTGDNFGTFGWSDEGFIAMLNTIISKESIDQVILNGDIYELYKYSYDEIYTNHKELIDYFKDRNFIYIKGNHDHINDEGMLTYRITNSKNQVVHVEHGHNCDFLNGTQLGRVIAKCFFKIIQTVVKVNVLATIYHKIVEFDDQINRVPRKYDSYQYLKYALKLLKSSDVVIFGHTHKIETHKTYYLNSKKIYLNSGSCSHGRFQAVTLDTETLFYDTIKIAKNENTIIPIREKKKSRINILGKLTG